MLPLAPIDVDRTDDVAAASTCTAAPNDCSLRGAVAFANLVSGTTINVPSGTYNLTISGVGEGFSGNNAIGDLDIRGNNTAIVGAGAATTIINQTINGARVIEVNPFLDASFITSISGVTISGGRDSSVDGGGGIISGAINNVLTLTDCVFLGNSATGGGGGVAHFGGSLTVTGCTFSGNSTGRSGGAIAYTAGDGFGRVPSTGTLAVSGSTFSNNTANSSAAGGGALDLFNFNGGVSVYNVSSSSFTGNNAANGSGGAIIVESGPLTLTTSSLANNHAAASGGAIYSTGTAVSVAYSRLVGNTSTIAANGNTFFRQTGLFTADDNWWGINSGPGLNDFRQTGGTSVTPLTYLQLQASASPSLTCTTGGTSTITANIKKRNVGADLTVELTGLPPFPATFVNATPSLGNISGASANFVDGEATATFTAGATAGTAQVDVIGDNQTVSVLIPIATNATSDPADQAVCEGGTATFSTTASGPGPITFVWKKGATTLNNGDLGGRVTITSVGNSSTLTISNVQASDADTYTVEATGACNTAAQSATLTVNSPTTTSDPSDQTVCQGADANFSTTAGGTGPFHYSWTLDGSPFNGDSASITVPTGSLSVGNHTVSVTTTGACGSASQSATLTVQANTTATDPADATVCQGATASFSTTASGDNLHYAWTLDGSPFDGDNSTINVPTGSLSVGTHNIGLTVTGSCGTVSQTASLTVQENTATTDPSDQTVCQGAMAGFSTTASGTGPFSYAWTVDGSPFDGDSASINVDTTGLSVGNHTVSVTTTGACGSASQSATLTVQETTSTTDPSDQIVCQGAMAGFSTTASGTGPFSYAWTLDGSPFDGNNSSINVDTTGLSVGNHIVSVTTTGTCGSASQSATLTVNATTTTTDPADQSVCEGATANFSTTAGGTAPFHYAWTLDGNPYNGDSASISVNTTGFSQGAHTVTVTTTGSCGSATQSATLTVHNDPPVINVANALISVWPPNHQYQNFTMADFGVTASSGCDGDLTSSVVIVSVTSDELDDNPGGADGTTVNDIVIAGDCKSVQLRAERDGNLDGRVYTITFAVTDSVGNTTTGTARVVVPLNENGGAAVDSGPHSTVNGNCP
jgi:predicted outer membrane repeat protein